MDKSHRLGTLHFPNTLLVGRQQRQQRSRKVIRFIGMLPIRAHFQHSQPQVTHLSRYAHPHRRAAPRVTLRSDPRHTPARSGGISPSDTNNLVISIRIHSVMTGTGQTVMRAEPRLNVPFNPFIGWLWFQSQCAQLHKLISFCLEVYKLLFYRFK